MPVYGGRGGVSGGFHGAASSARPSLTLPCSPSLAFSLAFPRAIAACTTRGVHRRRFPPPRPSSFPSSLPLLRPTRNGFSVTNRPFLSARAEVAADATRRASEKRAAREAREAAARQRREAFLPGAVFTPEFAANDRVVLRFYGPFGYRCCLVLFLSLL